MSESYRQYAVRAGVRLPVAEEIKGGQPNTDVRARIEFVYHF